LIIGLPFVDVIFVGLVLNKHLWNSVASDPDKFAALWQEVYNSKSVIEKDAYSAWLSRFGTAQQQAQYLMPYRLDDH